MLKFLLIALILVHATLQIEIVPDQSEFSDEKQIEAKKHFKNKEWKKHKNHDEWREEYEYHGKKRHHEEGGKKSEHSKHDYEKSKKYNHEKYEKNSKMMPVPAEIERFDTSPKVISLLHDIDVNPDVQFNKNNQKKYEKNEKINSAEVERFDERPEVTSMLQGTNVNLPKNLDSETFSWPKKDFYNDMEKLDLSTVPDPNSTILMARYIVHHVDWAAMATVTSRSGNKNQPFANVLSMSDGPEDQGSGVPFFYITPMDLSSQDLAKENKASITVTLAQTDFCRKQTLDPEDPRCARVILSGKIKRVKAGTTEETFAKKALFSRHPSMETWPKDHDFFFAKMKIGQIVLLDQFGGPKYLNVQEYLHPTA